MYNPTKKDLTDKTRFTLYVTNYVNGDLEKLKNLCKFIGKYYKKYWNFRIDENIIDDVNLIASSISGNKPIISE
jgi:hypothetical protein